jgi:SAM-dependent methyltransferase
MAFDPLASTYDHDFTHTAIGRTLRGRVHARLDRHFAAGDHVLELGCGTGEDALHLAERGVRVTATDASPVMLDIARRKTQHTGLVNVQSLDLRQLPPNPSPYSGAFASFGVLNCLDDWRPLATWLAAQIPSGGIAAFGVMSPLCVWETAWHGIRGDFRTAFRRLRGASSFTSNGETIRITYPSIRRLERDFAPHFKRFHVEPLGLLLPPSDVYGVIERRPGLLCLLTALDARASRFSTLSLFADHYWIEFRRQA